MDLRPGLRLESLTSDTQVVVVKAPAGVDIDLRCGGQPMVELGQAPPVGSPPSTPATSATGEPALLGKRYASDELGLEVLCTKAGTGVLAVGDTPLAMKSAKPLPSSD